MSLPKKKLAADPCPDCPSGTNCPDGAACKDCKLCSKKMACTTKKMSESETLHVLSLAEATITDGDLESTEYEILKTGQYYDRRYGKFAVTLDLLQRLKDNFDNKVLGVDLALDLNHNPEDGARAWIKSLSIKNDKLFMKIKDVTSEGKQILKEKIFKYFSVEFSPFETVQNGKKLTIKDVLKGVALTNRPVIKGMSPTFLSEDVNNSVSKQDYMPNFIVELADHLLSKDDVSKEDASFIRTKFSELPEEDQTEDAEAKVEEVEAKADEVEAQAAQDAADAAKAEADAAAAEKAAADEAGNAEAIQASEKRVSLAEAKLAEVTQLAETLLAEKRERQVNDRVSSLTLSEKNKKGFSAVLSDDLKGFVSSLDEDQYAQFSDLMTKVTFADTTELGEGGEGTNDEQELKQFGDSKLAVVGSDVDSAIKELADKKNISYFEAAQIYAETKS